MFPALSLYQKTKQRNWRDDSVQLRTLFALAEEMSLIHSTHMVTQKDLMLFSGIFGPSMFVVHRQINKQNTHVHKIFKGKNMTKEDTQHLINELINRN